jgi:hypothetical protein
MPLTPQRTQYPPQLSNIKFRTPIQTATLTRQWDTFERVENYNDIVYQQLQQGNRGTLYYQFSNQTDLKDYAAGQTLHVNYYSNLPASTFASISTRPMPDVPVLVRAPQCTPMVPIRATTLSAPAASATTMACADMAIFCTVSTFNSAHHYQYNFPSAAEQMAYGRAEAAMDAAKIPSVPDYVCRGPMRR